MASDEAHHIALVGASYIDTILDAPFFPEEDSKLRAPSRVVRAGGNTVNTVSIIKQYSAKVGSSTVPLLISVLPDQSSRDYALFKQALPGVNLDFCVLRAGQPDAPASYIIRSAANGSRTIVSYNHLDEITDREIVESYDRMISRCESLKWIHFEGRNPEAVKACIQHIRSRQEPQETISLEIEKPGREGLLELVPLVDYVFFSRSWAQSSGANSLQQFLQDMYSQFHTSATNLQRETRTQWIFCTWGESGSGAVSIKSTKFECFILAPPAPVGGIVDSVGAGDVFIGSVISSLVGKPAVLGADVSKALEEANRVCVNKICREGFEAVV